MQLGEECSVVRWCRILRSILHPCSLLLPRECLRTCKKPAKTMCARLHERAGCSFQITTPRNAFVAFGRDTDFIEEPEERYSSNIGFHIIGNESHISSSGSHILEVRTLLGLTLPRSGVIVRKRICNSSPRCRSCSTSSRSVPPAGSPWLRLGQSMRGAHNALFLEGETHLPLQTSPIRDSEMLWLSR